jgi:shikimate kinase
MPAQHVVLVGAMGTGKSTIGRPLAAALGRRFVDNDDALEARVGMSAAQLAERDGIDALHDLEATLLLEALAAPDGAVIAAAASTIERADVRAALAENAFVVLLRADPAVLARRLPSSTRPFEDRDPADVVAEQARTRDALFAETADVTIETGVEPVATSVARAADAIARAEPDATPG